MEYEQIMMIHQKTGDKKYAKFLSDEGWKYDTETDALAGYARLIKAEQKIPLTWEEFWSELQMEGDLSAAQKLYRILRRHMDNGALNAYELYGYARHRWCVRCPEAVIAYQTGPKCWAVNNCGEAISEERAIQRLNSEWGFEASRIKLLGTPYYDATDWNFIPFRCGRYDWIMQNGDLHQIYQ
ncbi:hypothetical protein [Lawsonibacter sp. JLR.KK007]|uniref:hypothetical protein n=2 Tax=Oscillospiraceae TaxID=216572 RepID=UPI002FEF938B